MGSGHASDSMAEILDDRTDIQGDQWFVFDDHHAGCHLIDNGLGSLVNQLRHTFFVSAQYRGNSLARKTFNRRQ